MNFSYMIYLMSTLCVSDACLVQNSCANNSQSFLQNKQTLKNIKCKVLKAVAVKGIIFWDVSGVLETFADVSEECTL
jgi:hypothetical protein